MALYVALINSPHQHKVRRAEMKQGEVAALPVDFLADIEIKAKRSLPASYYHGFLQSAYDDTPEAVPTLTKYILGETFMQHDLNYDGHYRTLYFRVKNDARRSKPKEIDPKEIFQ